MGKIFYLMGKSASGKDTLYKRLLETCPKLKTIISKREGADILKEEALKEGMHTLRMSATDYVLDGTTSFSEMVKVSFDV